MLLWHKEGFEADYSEKPPTGEKLWRHSRNYAFSFMAAPVAYGSFQARGQIGAATDRLHHSHSITRPEQPLWPKPQLTASPESLTHWAGPGFEPWSSWIQVRFLTLWNSLEVTLLKEKFPFAKDICKGTSHCMPGHHNRILPGKKAPSQICITILVFLACNFYGNPTRIAPGTHVFL